MFLWDYSVVRLKKMHTLGLSQTKYTHTHMFPHTYQDPNRLMWKMKKSTSSSFPHQKHKHFYYLCVTEKSLLIFSVYTSVIDFLE